MERALMRVNWITRGKYEALNLSRNLARDSFCFCLLPWYSGGGIELGVCGRDRKGPHPSPPPEYQGRGLIEEE